MAKKGSNPLPRGFIKPSPPLLPPPKKTETINFCGIYDPDDDSPEIRNLIEGQKPSWEKELAEAIAEYVIDILKREFGGTKNTKL